MQSFDAAELRDVGGQQVCSRCAQDVHGLAPEETATASKPFSAREALSRLGGGGADARPGHAARKPGKAAARSAQAAAAPARAREVIGGGSSFSDYVGRIGESFAYPLQGSGLAMILVGGLFFAVAGFIIQHSVTGWVLGIVVLGYQCAYFQKVIHAGAMGNEKLPPWPGFANFWDSILIPMFHVLGPTIVCIVGPIVVGAWTSKQFNIFFFTNPILWILLLAGIVYLPMSLLTVTIFGSIRHMSPTIVIRSILRIPASYAVACVLLGAITFMLLVGLPILQGIQPLMALGSSFVTLYLFIVAMRLLGLLFYDHQEELAWFAG
jgi:hypothetical protein